MFTVAFYLNYTIIEYLLQKGAYINYINLKGHNLLIHTLEDIDVYDDDDEEDAEYIVKRIEMCKWLIRNGVKFKYKCFVPVVATDNFMLIAPGITSGQINISASRYLSVINKYNKYDKTDKKFIDYIRDRKKASIPGGGKRSKIKTKRNNH